MDYETVYPEIMTVNDLKDYLRIGRNAAYNLVASGKVASFKVQGKIRIRRDAVIAFTRQHVTTR